MGEREGGRGTHCHETSTSSMNSSEVLTCTHDSNSLERGEEEVERGRGEVEWKGRKDEKGRGGGGREKRRRKGRKKKRKRRNAITLSAHWIYSLIPRPSLSTSIVLQVESEAQGTRLTF